MLPKKKAKNFQQEPLDKEMNFLYLCRPLNNCMSSETNQIKPSIISTSGFSLKQKQKYI